MGKRRLKFVRLVVISLLLFSSFPDILSASSPAASAGVLLPLSVYGEGAGGWGFAAAGTRAVTTHPRLWLTADDLPRLRAWAVDSNPVYANGIAALAAQAKQDMDSGRTSSARVPAQDTGSVSWEEYPTEEYAELFAFMSLISSDPAAQADDASRARTLLMAVINQAAQGVAEGQPFRQPDFAINDRSRWYGTGFGLTVDWIYPTLTDQDKATIRQVFLRWIDEDENANTTSNNHPEPVGVTNDPSLISDPLLVRWAGNNYYNAHMRNIGLMALAFDPADDPDGKLQAALQDAAGAWLYVVDTLLRTDVRGGLAAEGFEYSPQSLGYAAQFLLALHTAGLDNTGPQTTFNGNPFWDDMIPAYLNSISPQPVDNSDVGQVYQPAWYGAGQNYWTPDFIEAFGPLGIYDASVNNTVRLNMERWIELNTAPGGAAGVNQRVFNQNYFHDAILYFLLLDPTAPAPTDPHPATPTSWYAPGLRRLLARTDWTPDASWFTFSLSWNTVDHQSGNGNSIEFYRRGEWLTKIRTGYDLDYGASDNLNTMALENDQVQRDPSDYRYMLWQRGSQWLYIPAGDPPPPLTSVTDTYVYAQGDATNLYNSTYENLTDILHASRSALWLKPDTIVVFDRAISRTGNRFKRFWLNFPTQAVVNGSQTTMTTPTGQQLFVTTLLPADAQISVEAAPEEASGPPANGEPMAYRLRVEAPGGPQTAYFLNVLQGADSGAPALAAATITSDDGAFVGAQVGNTLVLFRRDLSQPAAAFSYTLPAGVTTQFITGLEPGQGYTVSTGAEMTITPGGSMLADSGGVLVISQ